MSKKEIEVSLYTIADLGELQNLKSDYANAIIKALGGKISRVFCRDYKGYDKKFERIAPGGKILFQIIYLLKRFFLIKIDIYSVLDLFSYFKKDNSDIILFHPYSFGRTCEKFNKTGKITINFGTSATGKFIFDMNRQEFLKYGFAFSKNYTQDHLEKSLLNSKFIVSQSEYCKSTYIKAGFPAENIFVLTGGVDLDKFKPGTKKDDMFRVLAIADYGLLKGFQYLLEAWSTLDLRNSELVILGNPSREMKIICEKYKNYINIKFINHSNPLNFLHQASIVVHPSLTEGSARVIKEAMACGLPVICTENSGSIIIDGQDGFIIPIRDSEKIKEKILFFYDNQEKTKEMGGNARKNIENYSWDNFSIKLQQFINKLITDKK